MRLPKYEDFDPKDGCALSAALYKYGQEETVEALRRYETAGQSWISIQLVGGQYDHVDDQARASARILKDNIKQKLETGELVAFGLTLDNLPKHAHITPQLLSYARLDFRGNRLTVPGRKEPALTHVVVFKPLKPGEDAVDRSVKTFSQAALARAYRDYVAQLLADGKRSSRDEDHKAMVELLGDGVTVSAVRGVRRDFAPKGWTGSGRPPKVK